MAAPLTLTAYAAHRGCSVKSVSIAVRDRRLVASVGRDEQNRPTIVDVELADQEWTANTRQRVDQPTPRPPRLPDPPLVEEMPGAAAIYPPPTAVPAYNVSRDLRAAADARNAILRADLAELELQERRGEVVPVDEARDGVLRLCSMVKTRLLGVPHAVGQRLPEMAATVVPIVDELIREALQELAANGGSAPD